MFSKFFETKKESTNFKIKGDGPYAGYPVLDILFKHSDKHISDKKLSEIRNIIKNTHYNTNMPLILNMHGHDPVLHYKSIIDIVKQKSLFHISHLIIETTGAAPVVDFLTGGLNEWIFSPTDTLHQDRRVIWSNSPKLSGSKGKLDIRPENVLLQRGILGYDRFDQYFKFSCGASREDFLEVQSIMNQYYDAGLPLNTKVYVLPTKTKQKKCAELCLEYGFIYSNSSELDEYDKATVV